ncbi:hypothetical protein EPR50_G00086370 [Perca flavescens]|uniref:Uncharacterized protein n=1 Tax=Perca flavescens TaxID=8167 RepID=A0A484D2C2_PERFV|nr:hypothetical protein EPR50_G00086370 [Perca flavescens]
MQVDAVFCGVRLRKMRNHSKSTSSGLTQLRKSPSACIVVRRQAGVETSPRRTEEFRGLQKVSLSRIRDNKVFADS